ncbi:MAG: glycosyltransferase family 25 protein [Sphingobacteriaceae bacterium]|nr:glycosyltransferase family 25 protein [Sphingobacteriaceae bacterium]
MKRITKYLKHGKSFILSENKKILIKQLTDSIQNKGLKEGIQSFLHQQHQIQVERYIKQVIAISKTNATILTTKHCLFVANLIKSHLSKIGVVANIILDKPANGYADHLHYVICPQIFSELPPFYVAFQMEQSVSSRWFNSSYFKQLENAFAVFEYSLVNVEYLLANKMGLQQIFYLPIYYFADYANYLSLPEVTTEEYDVVFYGDVNNQRRKDFIAEISKKHKVKILSEVFGDELLQELRKAKIVINIHYYEGALLETTRIYECLSLDRLVISESASDMEHHVELASIIDFVPLGDMAIMAERVDFWLSNETLRKQKIIDNQAQLSKISNQFSYCFYRYMLAKDLISYQKFYPLMQTSLNQLGNFWCLSLPESQDRRRDFMQDNKFNIQVFNGMRHATGWIGCALSFKTMINHAKDLGLDYVIICEDDVEFYPNFANRLQLILEYLTKNTHKWDIFSGLIANLHPDTKVLDIEKYQGEEFVYIDKMTSTVCNIYNASCFDSVIAWDEQNRNAEINTIDRYLESHERVRVVTLLPFLVGHKEEQHSTLWGFQNTQYKEWIENSTKLLHNKIMEYKENNK